MKKKAPTKTILKSVLNRVVFNPRDAGFLAPTVEVGMHNPDFYISRAKELLMQAERSSTQSHRVASLESAIQLISLYLAYEADNGLGRPAGPVEKV